MPLSAPMFFQTAVSYVRAYGMDNSQNWHTLPDAFVIYPYSDFRSCPPCPVSLVYVKGFQQGAPFVRYCHNPRFPAHRRHYCQGPHMFLNNIPFPCRELILFHRVVKRNARMVKAMQSALFTGIMPVI